MPSPILARADALMQRRRSPADADGVPVLTDAIDLSRPESDDDIPVLRHSEPAQAPVPPATPAAKPEDTPFPTLSSDPIPRWFSAKTPIPAAHPPAVSSAVSSTPAVDRKDIARKIARRVEQRLAAELPRLIAAAVADYLAEQD
ncbi:MAG: hypothetical protein FWC58_09420 [Desulfobulbus sp.]|nr:hypothetical protein [Desulfobulbus sp.]